MTMVMKIEEEIKSLPKSEFSKLKEWFLEYDSKMWDKEILRDSQMGKLDNLAQQAIEDYKNSRYKSL